LDATLLFVRLRRMIALVQRCHETLERSWTVGGRAGRCMLW
jgi:hypothetical protein